MKILLTGATGFTGKHFIRFAQSQGHEIVPLRSNLTQQDDVDAEVSAAKPDAVVHLGAISFVGNADLSAFYAVNTVGTTNLLNALQKLDVIPSKVLLASSANVYGNCINSPISEDQIPAPVNHYAASKQAMESMAETYLSKLPVVIARPFNYTGAGQSPDFVIPKIAEHFRLKKPVLSLGNMQVEREYNNVAHVCDNYLQLLRHGEPGETYNVCSGTTYSLETIINKFRELTNHTIQVEQNAAFVRHNEVHSLCGSNRKISALYTDTVNPMSTNTLDAVLSSMLLTNP